MDKKIFSFNTANIPKLTEVGGKAKALIETTKALNENLNSSFRGLVKVNSMNLEVTFAHSFD
ncbi:hypothetical protein [Vallitalea guaymasensis]|uniref:hypothetical protein n=1 Tax=Vallitalea guaymasensis TaxID=1185412 RepID=UPI000DE4E896|nr:hypothetical protein [Vallitalea guaymasensis]